MNILKDVKFEQSPAMERGSFIHKALELRLTAAKTLPQEAQHMEPIMRQLVSHSGKPDVDINAEQQLAIKHDGTFCDWFAKDVEARCIMDVTIKQGNKLDIWDWKTGKVKKPSDQLMVNALFGFLKYPEVTHISTRYIWVDHKERNGTDFTRAQLPEIKQNIGERVELIQITHESGNWQAKKNCFCKWCPLSKEQCSLKPE
jgi:hypothetical protein